MTSPSTAPQVALKPEPRVYDDRELLELFQMLLRSQIREERINSYEELHGLLRHVEQALSAPTEPVPLKTADDWVLVPRKATGEMVAEARASLPGPNDLCDADLEDIYETMIAAAPKHGDER